MFKTETHIHTSEVSSCSWKKAREMARLYKEAGYSTIFISDHFQSNSIDVLGDLKWNEKTAVFLSGYYKAKTEGDKIGLNVLPAAEFCFADSKNHFLAYGITKEFLDANPDIHKLTAAEFSRIAHEAGLFIVHAHPFRDGKDGAMPELVDAIEVYNSNPRHEDHSELSEALAREHNLPVSSGSDAHRDEDVALAGIMTEFEIKTVEDFIRAVKSGELEIIKGAVAE